MGTKKKKNPQTTKVPERDGESSQLSSVQGARAAHPKLISLPLLWSAGRWRRKSGSGIVMEGRLMENGIH